MEDEHVSAEEKQVNAEETPLGHRGGPPLYGRMMSAIHRSHRLGNTIRMVKLPLIFAEPKLYAGAIAQFFWLTETLEAALRRHCEHPMVARVNALGLNVTPGYASGACPFLLWSLEPHIHEGRCWLRSAFCTLPLPCRS